MQRFLFSNNRATVEKCLGIDYARQQNRTVVINATRMPSNLPVWSIQDTRIVAFVLRLANAAGFRSKTFLPGSPFGLVGGTPCQTVPVCGRRA